MLLALCWHSLSFFLFHRNLTLISGKAFFCINHVSFDLGMLKGTRTASEQQTVSMELTIVIKLLLQQSNYICQEAVVLKDLNKSVEHF